MRLPNSSGEKWLRKEAVSRMSKPCLEFGISFQLHPADEEPAVASSAKCCASTTLGELRWDSGCEGEFSPATLVRGDARLLSEVTVAVLEVAVVARCCQHMSCYIISLLNSVSNSHSFQTQENKSSYRDVYFWNDHCHTLMKGWFTAKGNKNVFA